MPTTITKIVDPDNGVGTDYTSLSAFEAAIPADITVTDEIWTASCRSSSGTADTTPVTVSGITVDTTRYVVLAGDATSGIWSSSKYRIVPGSNHAITVQINNVQITGMQVEVNSTGGGHYGIGLTGHNLLVEKSIIRKTGTGFNLVGINAAGRISKIKNCVVYGFSGHTGQRGARVGGFGGDPTYVHNVTLYDCYFGLEASFDTTVRASNVVAQACTDGFYATFNSASNNNCSDIASDAPGGASLNGVSVTFASAGSGDFRLSASDASGCKTGGKDLSADANLPVTVDIAGASRTAPFSIGAFEFAQSGAAAIYQILHGVS